MRFRPLAIAVTACAVSAGAGSAVTRATDTTDTTTVIRPAPTSAAEAEVARLTTAAAQPDTPQRFAVELQRAYALVSFVEALTPPPPAPEPAVTELEEAEPETEATEPEPKAAPIEGSGRCGGDLPDCSIMDCESGGNLTAQNPSSTASGKWQFLNGTWDNYGGYPTAADAPEEIQDQRAREVWDNGNGAGHWAQCR